MIVVTRNLCSTTQYQLIVSPYGFHLFSNMQSHRPIKDSSSINCYSPIPSLFHFYRYIFVIPQPWNILRDKIVADILTELWEEYRENLKEGYLQSSWVWLPHVPNRRFLSIFRCIFHPDFLPWFQLRLLLDLSWTFCSSNWMILSKSSNLFSSPMWADISQWVLQF